MTRRPTHTTEAVPTGAASDVEGDEVMTAEFEVHHLGEDGDDWLVTGTTKDTPDSAIHIAVAKEILDVIGIDKDTLDTIEGLPEFAILTFRPDWGYEPIDPEQPDDECYLVHGDKVPNGVEKFAGTRVFI